MGNILILDDEKLTCLQLMALVKNGGHTCDFITHSHHLFPMLEQEAFDLILMDLYMPGIDGLTLLQQLKEHSKFQVIPVLVLTAEMSDVITAQCFELGATDYLHKPVQPQTLSARIQTALDAKRSKEQLERLVQQRTEELQKRTEESILANQNKDKFFSIIAHDLRSPLSNLQRLTDFLANDAGEMAPSTIMDFSKRVNKSAVRLQNLLENLLQWSRMQTGELKPVIQNVSLRSIIDRVIQIYAESLNQKSIQYINQIDRPFMVRADSEMLQSILQNLVSNAIKYTYREGWIKLEAAEKGEQIAISVSDSGVGMSVEKREALFHIEFRQSQLGTEAERGTGLGLMLCKEFVEKQGGHIEVKSDLGEGSTFTFTLRRVAEPAKSSGANSKPSFHILIVDDDTDQQLLSELVLKQLGHTDDLASDGLEALEKLKSQTYDLILMDVYMPKMDGIQATRTIHEEYPSEKRPKILGFTGDATQECQQRCEEAGMDGFIKKNSTREELCMAIEGLLL